MLITINEKHPQPRLITEVVRLMRQGEVVVFPTETTYALGCDIFNLKGIQKIFKIKNEVKPLSFLCEDLSQLSEFSHFSTYAYKTMRRLFPGPYTFVLEASKKVPKVLVGNRKTVGVRIPAHPIALAILAEMGRPIISTSVRFGEESPLSDPREIHTRIRSSVGCVVDGGIIPPQESTVVDLMGDEPVIIREGLGDTAKILSKSALESSSG